MFQRLRMHLNGVDTGSGNGAAVPPTSTPTAAGALPDHAAVASPGQPPANGGAAAQTIDVNSIVKQISDGVFATLRRSGVLGNEGQRSARGNGAPAPGPEPTPPAQPAQANGGSDQTVDVHTVLKRERAFNRALSTTTMSEAQRRRIEAAFEADHPSDVVAWVGSYLDDMGLRNTGQPSAPATTQSATTTATTVTAQPTNQVPVTASGHTPPPSGSPEDRDMLKMSKDDIDAFVRTHGVHKFLERARASLKGRKFPTR